MKNEYRDFSGMGLFEDAYSYDRPAWIAVNAIMNALMDKGFTKEQAYNWVYSKSYRWFLDSKDHVISKQIYKLVSNYIEGENPNDYNEEVSQMAQEELEKCV